jgi:hypothetical protein
MLLHMNLPHSHPLVLFISVVGALDLLLVSEPCGHCVSSNKPMNWLRSLPIDL